MAISAKRRVRRRCEELAARLPEPDSDLSRFISAVAEQRGRPIEVIPIEITPDTPCGMCVSTDGADYIFVAQQTTPLHRYHIALHELAHLLCGHLGTGADDSVAKLFAPHLSTQLVRRVLGRTVYSEAEEHEAELLASLIAMRGQQRFPAMPAGEVPSELRSGMRKLEGIFDE
jgi:hypothetical protein